MIKKYFFALAAMVLGSASAMADNLTINDFSMSAGETKNIEILLDNTSAVQSLGMYIELPAGITMDAANVALVSSRAPEADDMIAANNVGQVCRVAMLGIGGKAVVGNSGALFTIPVKVAEGTADGDYELTLSNVELSTTDNKAINLAQSKVKLTVSSGKVGDVTGDGEVNIDDVSAIIAVICGDPTYADKANVNGDQNVDIDDVSAVINIICGN